MHDCGNCDLWLWVPPPLSLHLFRLTAQRIFDSYKHSPLHLYDRHAALIPLGQPFAIKTEQGVVFLRLRWFCWTSLLNDLLPVTVDLTFLPTRMEASHLIGWNHKKLITECVPMPRAHVVDQPVVQGVGQFILQLATLFSFYGTQPIANGLSVGAKLAQRFLRAFQAKTCGEVRQDQKISNALWRTAQGLGQTPNGVASHKGMELRALLVSIKLGPS